MSKSTNAGSRTGLGGAARLWLWGTIAAVLLLPAIAMRISPAVRWTAFDFVTMGLLLGACGLAVELVARSHRSAAYRLGVALAVVGLLLLTWVQLAVGIVGNGGDPLNLAFAAAPLTGIAGSIAARFRPAGLARSWASAGVLQVMAAGAVLAIGSPTDGPAWPRAVVALSVILCLLWLSAAALFRRAERD